MFPQSPSNFALSARPPSKFFSKITKKLIFVWITSLLTTLILNIHYVQAQDVFQQLTPEAQLLANLINKVRVQQGMAPLLVNIKLTRAAQLHADDMVHSNFFGHYGQNSQNGSTHYDRIQAQGYQSDTLAETIAGKWSAEEALFSWLQSSEHKANLLNPQFTELGLGISYGHRAGWDVYVVDFGSNDITASVYDNAATQATDPLPDISIPEAIPLQYGYGVITVNEGDTIATISQAYQVSADEVARVNQMAKDTPLQAGETLQIPLSVPKTPPVNIPLNEARPENWDPSLESSSNSSGNNSTQPNELSTAAPSTNRAGNSCTSTSVQQTVQQGDTLWAIGQKWGITWQTLAAANQLQNPDFLYIGQVICIPN